MHSFGPESLSLTSRNDKTLLETEDGSSRELCTSVTRIIDPENQANDQEQSAHDRGCWKSTTFMYKIKVIILLIAVCCIILMIILFLRHSSSFHASLHNSSLISNGLLFPNNLTNPDHPDTSLRFTENATPNLVSSPPTQKSPDCNSDASDPKDFPQVNLNPGPFDEPNQAEYRNVLSFVRKRFKTLYASENYLNPHNNTLLLSTLDQLEWHKQLKVDSLWEMNLLIPNKSQRGQYFESLNCKSNRQPAQTKLERYAQIVIFHGSETNPVVREYQVGPMDNPYSMDLLRVVDFHKRPLTSIEYGALLDFLAILMVPLDEIVQLAYGASFFMARPSKRWTYPIPGLKESDLVRSELRSRCLAKSKLFPDDNGRPECLVPMFASAMVTHKAPGRRRLWFRLTREVAPLIQYPVDIQFNIDHTSLNPAEWSLEQIWFQGHSYESINQLVEHYRSGQLRIRTRQFREMYAKQLKPGPNQLSYSPKIPINDSSASPRQSTSCDFDTNRISINQRHVKYMNWDFHVTLRRDTGLRIFGVHYDGMSLVSEVGLEETVTAYWGSSPFIRAMTSLETMFGVGGMTAQLSPGLDCPRNAIFLPIHLVPSGEVGPQTIDRAICLFESTAQTLGGPIRRHFEFQPYNAGTSGGSDSPKHTNFAFGAPNRVLVVRAIASLFNYDYLFDLVFHASGAMEVAVTPTGYVHVDVSPDEAMPKSTFGWDHSDAYGFASPLFPIHFVIHHHLFLFKVDLDVVKPDNFVKVIDILGPLTEHQNREQGQFPGHHASDLTPALWMTSHVLENEMQARLSVKFEKPKQYLICQSQDQSKNKPEKQESRFSESSRRNARCLALVNKAPIKTIFNDNHTKSFAWSRHQLHVTKQHDNEPFASSIYNGVDLESPVVDFTKFSSNNESILDQDIVLWVTVGNYHLPRQEDLPSTPTSSGRLSFFLMPHNLFQYSPDAYSCDRFYTRNLNEWLNGPKFSSKCDHEPVPLT